MFNFLKNLKKRKKVATKKLVTGPGKIVEVETAEESFREFGFEKFKAGFSFWAEDTTLTIEGLERWHEYAIIWFTAANSRYPKRFCNDKKTEKDLLGHSFHEEKTAAAKFITTVAGNAIKVDTSEEAFKIYGFKKLRNGKRFKDPYGFHCTVVGVGYLNDKPVICATRDGCQACMCFQPIEKNFKLI